MINKYDSKTQNNEKPLKLLGFNCKGVFYLEIQVKQKDYAALFFV